MSCAQFAWSGGGRHSSACDTLHRQAVRGQQRRNARGVGAPPAAFGRNAEARRHPARGSDAGAVAARIGVMEQAEYSVVSAGSDRLASGAK